MWHTRRAAAELAATPTVATPGLRCPVIPGVNDNPAHFEAIADIANGLEHLTGIDLEPYHPLGLSKAERIGESPAFAREEPLPREQVEPFVRLLRSLVCVPVRVQ